MALEGCLNVVLIHINAIDNHLFVIINLNLDNHIETIFAKHCSIAHQI